jgi:hypothetical protein
MSANATHPLASTPADDLVWTVRPFTPTATQPRDFTARRAALTGHQLAQVGDRVRFEGSPGWPQTRIGRMVDVLSGLDAGMAVVVDESDGCQFRTRRDVLTVLGGAR